jgi:environmental stress-induced protein Ves
MRILRAEDHKRMPWKNGGGETVEIAVFPERASLEDFDWRVSMARVDSDGPFSIFPGIDRTLAILDGAGMVLDIAGRDPVRLISQTPPYAFPADLATSATLIDGTVIDFNVMTRRGKVNHRVNRHGETVTSPSGTTRLVLCSEGTLDITGSGEQATLGRRDAAILDRIEAAELAPGSGSAFYLVTFHTG